MRGGRVRMQMVAVAVVVVLAGCGSQARSKGTSPAGPPSKPAAQIAASSGSTELAYSALPYGSSVTPEKLRAAVALLASRLTRTGAHGSVALNSDEIVIRLSGLSALSPLLKSSPTIYFYDWEPNVIGASGRPSPTDASVTGGSEAGSAKYGLSEYRAVVRAARRSPELREDDTTWQPGCTPQQTGGCLYGSWYMLDPAHKKLICPHGASHCGPALTRGELLASTRPSSSSHLRLVRVNPGTILVQARPTEAPDGRVVDASPDSYYVLKDDPALSGAALTHPQPGTDEVEGGTGPPNVTFGFTREGATAFEDMTREVAHRGLEARLPGVAIEDAEQHFAVALDGQLITVPTLDFRRFPEGLDASQGSEISGGFDAKAAQELAQEIEAGTLPVRIVLRRETFKSKFR